MVRKAFLLVTGLAAALIAAAPQTSAQQGAPRVRVTSQPHSSFGTIEPSLSLSEPSYVLAVAIDRDGQVSVLSPVGPNDMIRFQAARSLRLPEFFSGFSTASTGYYGGYQSYHYASSYIRSMTDDYSAGSILVIASKTPFNFAAISQGPFWNEDAIKKLVRYRDPSSAVYALGRAITAKGQSFGHDYLRFGASRYQLASVDPCSGLGSTPWGYAGYSDFYGYNGFSGTGFVITPATTTTEGLQLISIRTDGCGRIRYLLVPTGVIPPTQPAPVPVPVDSATAPKPEARSAGAAPRVYTGDAAREVFEMLKNRTTTETYVGLPMHPILRDKEDGPISRTVTRGAEPERAETFERVRSFNANPFDRAAPVLRQEEPRQAAPASQPIMRSEPVMQSAPGVQRESKPAEVVSTTKDN